MLRSGTENVPGIGGFGMAADMKFSRMAEEAQKVAGVKAAILKGLESCSFDWKVISPGNSSPYILNVAFPGLRSEVLLHHLEERNIYVSTGSACASRKKSKSHVLSAMGLSPGLVDSAVRFSFSAFNNDGDAAEVIDALNEIVPRITIKKNRR
jgi:cysteine desulfurase